MPVFFDPVSDFCSMKPFINLNIGNLDLGMEYDPSLLTFNMHQYPELARKFTTLQDLIAPVNMFLRTLSTDDQRYIVIALIHLHGVFLDFNAADTHGGASAPGVRSAFDQLLDSSDTLIASLDKSIDLMGKAYAYVDRCVPIDDMSENGTLPQHLVAMTFKEPEVKQLTTIALVCKLFAPVFSTILAKAKQYTITAFREMDVASVLTSILRNYDSRLILKFKFYIKSLIVKRLILDHFTAYHGITDTSMAPRMYAVVLIKTFVTRDITNGNITKHMTAGTRSGVANTYDNAKKKANIQPRENPSDDIAGDEGNTSRFELESKPTKYTGDFPMLMEHEIDWVWKDFTTRNNLDMNVIKQMAAFYTLDVRPPSRLSIHMLSTFYGEALGGGKSIEYASLKLYVKLVSTMQLILVNQGKQHLAHSLTMRKSPKLRTDMNESSQSLSLIWKCSGEYQKCKTRFGAGFGEKTWDDELANIVNELDTSYMIYHTAPVLWEILGMDNLNGTIVQEQAKILTSALDLIYYVHFGEVN